VRGRSSRGEENPLTLPSCDGFPSPVPFNEWPEERVVRKTNDQRPIMSKGRRIRDSRLWRSIVREAPEPARQRRVWAVLSNWILHVHPTSIRKHALKMRFTWCMGGITALLFLIEVVTGVLLMFYYRPTVGGAYADVHDLHAVASFGILRELHRWGAHAMVITVMLHMLRVFLTGSYKPPREFNWVVGVGLLVLTLLLSFTGYLLPWDQLSIWATEVGTNMAGSTPVVGHEGAGQQVLELGGSDVVNESSDVRALLLGSDRVGPETLLRFYVLHCVALPLATVFLMGLHFWRIRKDGGASSPL